MEPITRGMNTNIVRRDYGRAQTVYYKDLFGKKYPEKERIAGGKGGLVAEPRTRPSR